MHGIVASVHTTVTVQASNTGWYVHDLFVHYTQEGEGLVEEIRGEDIFAGEDTYAR